MSKDLLKELAEIHNCVSIVSLACAQMMKIKLQTVKKDGSYNDVKTLDNALTKLYEHLVILENMIKDLK